METRCLGCMRLTQQHPVCEHCGFDERSRNNKHQLPMGTEVGGQYILGRVLGQGGFGITYIGWDRVMNQTVAVKEYFPSGFAGRDTHDFTVTSYDDQDKHSFESNKKRFLREAESLAKLWNIPQIVKILRCFEENGTAYIAMEYVEGMDLRRYLKQLGRPMTIEETMSILGPVMEALSHVHKAELVHRDISPDNIMVLPDGSAKLLDFGAARYVENADAEKDRNTSTQAILKHGFAPPEQYRSHGALGPWTDVYAMCATIYYCLTGKVPPEAMARTVDEEAIDWTKVHGLTPKQKAALEKGMALQAKNRFPSVGELWQEMKPVPPRTQPKQQEPKPSTPVRKPEPKMRSGKKFLISAAIAGAVLVAIGLLIPKKEPSVSVPKESAAPETVEESTAAVPTAEPTATGPSTVKGNVTCIFEENETGWTITGYTGQPPAIMILPSKYEGKPVTSIGWNAFYACTDLTSVIIPDSVISIGESAFNCCFNLTKIIIPDSVLSIGDMAFLGCSSLTSITVPNSVTSIGCNAFQSCISLKNITLSSSLSAIDTSTFNSCNSLSSITIPDGVTSIGAAAFRGCTDLISISIPDSVTIIEEYVFTECSSLKEVTISRSCELGENAFPDTCTIHYYKTNP